MIFCKFVYELIIHFVVGLFAVQWDLRIDEY